VDDEVTVSTERPKLTDLAKRFLVEDNGSAYTCIVVVVVSVGHHEVADEGK
jgi:hypothetical protein